MLMEICCDQAMQEQGPPTRKPLSWAIGVQMSFLMTGVVRSVHDQATVITISRNAGLEMLLIALKNISNMNAYTLWPRIGNIQHIDLKIYM